MEGGMDGWMDGWREGESERQTHTNERKRTHATNTHTGKRQRDRERACERNVDVCVVRREREGDVLGGGVLEGCLRLSQICSQYTCAATSALHRSINQSQR